jgi:hypothetical protein
MHGKTTIKKDKSLSLTGIRAPDRPKRSLVTTPTTPPQIVRERRLSNSINWLIKGELMCRATIRRSLHWI